MAIPPAPYRGRFGAVRPVRLESLALPPAPMASHDRGRPLKSWRYVGVFCDELMLCAATVRIGPARQCFWAIWDRRRQRLHERTALGTRAVLMSPGRLTILDRVVQVDLELDEGAGVETVCPSGDSYGWTRKQAIEATGRVMIDGQPLALRAPAIIDDTAAYYERHTRWRWSAGVGSDVGGATVAWNLVQGVNDPAHESERTVWIDGEPREAPPVTFADDLSDVGGLRFAAEATRERSENLLLVRSRYRQPFGTFSGVVPGTTVALAHGLGVMEEHDVRW